jgi:hypothetical protein
MKIDRISANIRYSKDTGQGAWKTVELAAEASVTPSENWQEAQAQLYAELGQQMKALWSNGNGNGHHKAENGAVATAEPKSEPQPTERGPTTARSTGRNSRSSRRMARSGTATGWPKVAIAGRSSTRALKLRRATRDWVALLLYRLRGCALVRYRHRH